MNKSLTIALVVVGVIVLGALIFGSGFFIGRSNLGLAGYGPNGMTLAPEPRAGVGWASNNNDLGYSMMDNGYGMSPEAGIGNGMMNGAGLGGSQTDNTANAKPLTIDQAKQAVASYLARLNNPDLELKEIMIFDNNAYAHITEKSTGIGAMELLVDPTSQAVFPEYGPNMMWNLKYGHMGGSGYGGMTLAPAPRAGMGSGGMMGGGYYNNSGSDSTTMAVTPEQALKITQQYLDQQFPGCQAAADADPFYGYYTIDIHQNDQPTGMLSVNGFSGQVFLHTWHGTFIEMWE